jgi:hypothetical protein
MAVSYDDTRRLLEGVIRRAPASSSELVAGLAGEPVVPLPGDPWSRWLLVALHRHIPRQLWVAEIVRQLLDGNLQRIAVDGGFGHPIDRPQEGPRVTRPSSGAPCQVFPSGGTSFMDEVVVSRTNRVRRSTWTSTSTAPTRSIPGSMDSSSKPRTDWGGRTTPRSLRAVVGMVASGSRVTAAASAAGQKSRHQFSWRMRSFSPKKAGN